jgi:hypothetical protein
MNVQSFSSGVQFEMMAKTRQRESVSFPMNPNEIFPANFSTKITADLENFYKHHLTPTLSPIFMAERETEAVGGPRFRGSIRERFSWKSLPGPNGQRAG